jgi:hypothetical protein
MEMISSPPAEAPHAEAQANLRLQRPALRAAAEPPGR